MTVLRIEAFYVLLLNNTYLLENQALNTTEERQQVGQ